MVSFVAKFGQAFGHVFFWYFLISSNSSASTFTKSPAQILSRDIGFYDIVARRKGYFKTITLTLTSAIIPILTPSLISTLTLRQAVENEIFVSLAGHVN